LIPIDTFAANLPNRTQIMPRGSQLVPFPSCPLDLAVFSGSFTEQY